jgi:hypothetical protein
MKRRCRHFDPREAGAAISLRADRGVATTGSAVDSWTSSDPTPVVATSSGSARPTFVASSSSFGGFPAMTISVTQGFNLVVTAAAVFNNKSYGHTFISARNDNPTGGNARHSFLFLSGAGGVTRHRILLRDTSVEGLRGTVRRLDGDSTRNTALLGSTGTPSLFELVTDWASNQAFVVSNGVAGSVQTYSSGAGSTSATDSSVAVVNGAAFPPAADEMAATFTQITVFNTAIPDALAARVRHNSARAFHIACS